MRVRLAKYGRLTDIAIRYADDTTVAEAAGALAPGGLSTRDDRVDRWQPVAGHDTTSGDVTLVRKSRSEQPFDPDARVIDVDLRSGDTVAVVPSSSQECTEQTVPVVTAMVVAGPDVGARFTLSRGEHVLGRSSKADIVLTDEMISRHHLTVRVTDIVEVADAESTNGVLVGGRPLGGSSVVHDGDSVVVGATEIEVYQPMMASEVVYANENRVDFNRPPRIVLPYQGSELAGPPPLANPVAPRLPLLPALGAAAIATILFLVTNQIYTIIFLAMSPVIAFATYFDNRRRYRKAEAETQADFARHSEELLDLLDEAAREEEANRHMLAPAFVKLLRSTRSLGDRLWERKPGDVDFLHLRVGLRARAAATTIKFGTSVLQRREIANLKKRCDDVRCLKPVPFLLDVGSCSPVGLAGPKEVIDGVARSLLVQAAILHSPQDLVIGALTTEESAKSWDWLKWLPHTDETRSPTGYSLIGVGARSAERVVDGLSKLIKARQDDDDKTSSPQVVMLVEDDLALDRPTLASLLRNTNRFGITLLWVTDRARRIPTACSQVVIVEPGGAHLTVGDSAKGTKVGHIPVEPLLVSEAEEVAMALAPIVDIWTERPPSDLPDNVSLVNLLGGPEMIEDPSVIARRWTDNASSASLGTLIGHNATGACSLDLREDGPHILVGGMTGSGKSGFLQSLIAGLAANHSPERLNFLLVDYKGGTAFGSLVDRYEGGRLVGPGLPHTVGLITDLTPALAKRALASLEAEIEGREKALNRARAKDLVELERMVSAGRWAAEDTPANLVIVIDEFAALARSVPEFVDGMVDVAERGRSLGLHLVLATQKPGTVVTPSIRANTALRIALRVADDHSSVEVIGSPEASRISRATPGRAVLRRSHQDLTQVQSAYVNGVTCSDQSAQVTLGKVELSGICWPPPPPQPEPSGGTVSDLDRLVTAVTQAAVSLNCRLARRPWVDALPDVLGRHDLMAVVRAQSEQDVSGETVPYAVTDKPSEQRRGFATFDPERDGSLIVCGMGRSGKSVLLRTLVAGFAALPPESPTHIYFIDGGGRGAEILDPYPQLAAPINVGDYDRVTRLFGDLQTKIDSRAGEIAASQASNLSEFRLTESGCRTPRVVVFIDGFDNFCSHYETLDGGRWVQALPRLVADGWSVGVHFVIAGTRRSSFPRELLAQIRHQVVLRLASPDDYLALGVDPAYFAEDAGPGRCWTGGLQAQVAIVGADPAVAAEAASHRAMATGDRSDPDRLVVAPPVPVLPDSIAIDDPALMTDHGWMIDADRSVVCDRIERDLLIAGPPGSGKSTALASLVSTIRRTHGRVVVFRDDPSPWPGAADDHVLTFELLGELDRFLRATADGQPVAIAIDGAENLSHEQLAGLAAVASVPLARLVLTGDTRLARSSSAPFATAIARGEVLLLQPDHTSDGVWLGERLQRSSRPYIPGRGLTTLHPSLGPVQVARPS